MQPVIIFKEVRKGFTVNRTPLDLKHHLIRLFRPGIKSHKEHRIVIDGFSFEIRKRDFVGIMGRNGVGKSTLLKLVSGIYLPDSGEIKIAGRLAPVLELGAGFADELSGYENIALNASILGYSRKQVEERIEEIIEFSELKEQIQDPVRNYSSGMMVRLAFSIACHLDADLLLFDEVLAVGDIGFQNKCLAKIRSLNAQGATIVLVSHSPEQIAAHCDRCLVLDHGAVIFDGKAKDGAQKYADLF